MNGYVLLLGLVVSIQGLVTTKLAESDILLSFNKLMPSLHIFINQQLVSSTKYWNFLQAHCVNFRNVTLATTVRGTGEHSLAVPDVSCHAGPTKNSNTRRQMPAKNVTCQSCSSFLCESVCFILKLHSDFRHV